MSSRILIVFGTRPEAIKMAPLVAALRSREEFEVTVCVTGQHRQMLDDVLRVFGIEPDIDLDIMRPGQTLAHTTGHVLDGVDQILRQNPADWVLVQGDTTTAFAAAFAGFYNRVKIGHVEAGLRSGNNLEPWPEEVNRKLLSVVTDLHFAPTDTARQALAAEGYPDDRILVTGNTIIDALHWIRGRMERNSALLRRLDERFRFLESEKRLVLVTGHRRESFGEGLRNICEGLARLSHREDLEILYPVHLNPNVRETVFDLLKGRTNVHLIEPVDYVEFVYLLNRAYVLLTDSGGIQEEACGVRKPVLVMRDRTERIEAIEAGAARLVGTNPEAIANGVSTLIDDPAAYEEMRPSCNPYGDGTAAERIAEAIQGRIPS